MGSKKFGLVAAGNAIVDILMECSDRFLAKHGSGIKGSMTLIDKPKAEKLASFTGGVRYMSGGSAANTVSAFASFGGTGAFIGKIGRDSLGDRFAADLKGQQVHYAPPPARKGTDTARSHIFITPDGERTMNTYLGTAGTLGPDDFSPALMRDTDLLLLEGYGYAVPDCRHAFEQAARNVSQAGGKVAFALSDASLVEQNHSLFNAFAQQVDLIFGNEREAKAFTRRSDFASAVRDVRDRFGRGVLTQGAKGAVIIDSAAVHVVEPVKPTKLIDSTGAGDAFAAGVLYGLSQNLPSQMQGALGAQAAAATIAHFGARFEDVKFSGFFTPKR